MKQEFRFTKHDAPGLLIKLRTFFGSLDDKSEYKITVDKVRKKRSLDANAYFWVLCDKVAEASGVPKTEIYRGYIKDVGGISDMYLADDNAVDIFCSAWSAQGIGFLTDTFKAKEAGKTCIIAYRGSSRFDTAQMSRLIDLAVQDCKSLGIETATPRELSLLLDRWGAK